MKANMTFCQQCQNKEYIQTNYDNNYYQQRIIKNKSENAQEAHECIRPVDVNIKPEDVSLDIPLSKIISD